jgi:hypothetical protein
MGHPLPCYHYAMTRTVTVRFVPPAPVKVRVSITASRTRTWDEEKLAEFLQAGLEPLLSKMIDDLELLVVVAKAADIRFNWKPENITELREQIGELIGTVMEDIEPDEYLSE